MHGERTLRPIHRVDLPRTSRKAEAQGSLLGVVHRHEQRLHGAHVLAPVADVEDWRRRKHCVELEEVAPAVESFAATAEGEQSVGLMQISRPIMVSTSSWNRSSRMPVNGYAACTHGSSRWREIPFSCSDSAMIW